MLPANKIIRGVYSYFFFSPHWRVGWRKISDGGLFTTQTLKGTTWNRLPDPGSRFYADPFPFTFSGRTVLFVEEYDHLRQKGFISALDFDREGPTGEMRVVLEEPWHLSYPFVMEHSGEVWMIPESSQNRDVALYRADPFPNRWIREATLISGVSLSDATVCWHDGRFWMFAEHSHNDGEPSGLVLFTSCDLFGPWIPHPGNPVLIDPASARPGGRMELRGDRIWRPVQDCRTRYGAALGLAEVTRLDLYGYEQRVRAVLKPNKNWPGRRLHTLNQSGNFEFIDGSANSPRSLATLATFHRRAHSSS